MFYLIAKTSYFARGGMFTKTRFAQGYWFTKTPEDYQKENSRQELSLDSKFLYSL